VQIFQYVVFVSSTGQGQDKCDTSMIFKRIISKEDEVKV
jgi:hypothetical protein